MKGGPTWRQWFRLGWVADWRQLQSYTILIGVVVESFWTGWCGMKWQWLGISDSGTSSMKPRFNWSDMISPYDCNRLGVWLSLLARDLALFTDVPVRRKRRVFVLPWKFHYVRAIWLTSYWGFEVRSEKLIIRRWLCCGQGTHWLYIPEFGYVAFFKWLCYCMKHLKGIVNRLWRNGAWE